MTQNQERPARVFMSAAEPSGDAHCAAVIRTLKQQSPAVSVVGVGGPKMEAAGCELLARPVERAVMLMGAIKEIFYFYGIFRGIRKYLRAHPVDLVVVCDSPAFNFHVAKAAKKLSVPTLFYVAPQLWAWASWRIHKLRRCCDKLCCILPFEEAWFRARGVDTTFVSNPLLDTIEEDLDTCIKTYENYEPQSLRLGLLPGSRSHEIESLWVPMQQIALRIKTQLPQATFVATVLSEERRRALEEAEIPGFSCEYRVDALRETVKQADLTLVASGSATLEVAAAGCPMLVMYKAPRLTILLVGWMVRTRIFSLVNLVAGKNLVPEFMPTFHSIDPLVAAALELAQDPVRMENLSRELVTVTKPLAERKTHQVVAETILEMIPALPSGKPPVDV